MNTNGKNIYSSNRKDILSTEVFIMNYHAPLYHALTQYTKMNKTPLHMPGHKQGRGIPEILKGNLFQIDLTELDGTDNLHAPEGPILEAQYLAAKAYGAERSFFLVNGSTCGIQTMIASVCNPGDQLIIDRNSHSSVVSALILCDVTPIYIYPEYVGRLGITGGLNPAVIEDLLKENPKAKGVLITSPTYYGLCSNIKEIAYIVHKYEKIFMVDEAHGAHFNFHKGLPMTAMEAGADLCVQSAHKTLPALTQSSLLHVRSNRVDLSRLKNCLRFFQSSSPSFILMAYLDIARSIMEYHGHEILDNLIIWANQLRQQMNQLKGIYCYDKSLIGTHCIYDIDLTRIVINFSEFGITGYEVAQILNHEYNIQMEMADFKNIVGILSPGTEEKELQKLGAAIQKILCGGIKNKLPPIDAVYPIPEIAMSPREAFYSSYRLIDMQEAVGKVSAATVVCYPPCIPILYPGEIISHQIVEYILKVQGLGGKVMGIEEYDKMKIVSQ